MSGKLWLRVLTGVVVLLVFQRVAYHSAYIGHDPFALSTFSDGQLYERAARDIAAHPPWGRQPFYLQGIYAMLLAVPLRWHPAISYGLLLQIVVVSLGLWAFARASKTMLGPHVGRTCTIVLLIYPGLAFYENKYLTAGLAEASLCLMLGALAWAARDGRRWPLVAFGAATGLSVLARGNMVLGVPAFAYAAVWIGRHHGSAIDRSPGPSRPGAGGLARFALGLSLSLSPMAIRNAVVTGRPTVFPAHGGGTSFYIGNNAEATGLWNTARGLLSGDVGREQEELVTRLKIADGTQAEQAAAMGRALYGRAFAEIADDPARWVRLEGRKVWLLTGNDELSQDYDAQGEAELIGRVRELGVPFSLLLALGIVGALGMRWPLGERSPAVSALQPPAMLEVATVRRAWLWTLAGMAIAIVAANLLFFTSAQHRAPLAVVLAALGGPGVVWLVGVTRDRARSGWRRIAPLLLVLLIVGQGAVPRIRTRPDPSAAHYHNLALVFVEVGQPGQALAALTRAVAVDPTHPVIRIERASLQRRLGHLDGAAADLDVLAAYDSTPAWVRARVAQERRRVNALRGLRRP